MSSVTATSGTAKSGTAKSRTAKSRAVRSKAPTLALERELGAGGLLVAGMDEVGRGCLAGPVSVGVVVVDDSMRRQPAGLRDSKLLSAARRQALVDPIKRWVRGHAVGHASPAEIDEIGIIAALRLAGLRALDQLEMTPAVVLLDGNHNWLAQPEDLFAGFDTEAGTADASPLRVVTAIKADMTCAAVAAASVLAKVERDAIMVAHGQVDTRFDWAANKGYASASHIEGLRTWGPSELHRRSWQLPGVEGGMMVS